MIRQNPCRLKELGNRPISKHRLDNLDRELERRGHKFVRYADDCNIYVRSKRAGERVMASVRRFLEERLRLRVNEEKSAVDRPWRRKFLGFSFYRNRGIRIRLAPRSVKRVKDVLRELTRKNRSQNLRERIERINTYLRGWVGYYALAETPRLLRDLEGWLIRRLRACLWKQWKRVRTRIRAPSRAIFEAAAVLVSDTVSRRIGTKCGSQCLRFPRKKTRGNAILSAGALYYHGGSRV